MINLNFNAHVHLKYLVLNRLRLKSEDTSVVNVLFNEVTELLQEPDYKLETSLDKVRQNDYPVKDFDFISPLQKYDEEITNSRFTTGWWLDESDGNHVDGTHLQELGEKAFLHLVRTDSFLESLLCYQLLASAFLGSIDNHQAFDEIDHSSFLEPYEELEPKVIAYILQKEYDGVTIKSVPEGVEPIDVSHFPEYLLEDNSQIIMKSGKVYLKVDVEKAITAAGGFAQALERQDLEGSVTNKGGKDDEDDSTTGQEDTGQDRKSDKKRKGKDEH